MLIYITFYAQINANQIQFQALMDEKKDREFERKVSLIEDQFKSINGIWLGLLKGIDGKNSHISFSSNQYISAMLSDGRISVLNDFLFRINVFMEEVKRNEITHEELKRKKILSQFAVLIGMSCEGFFNRIKRGLSQINSAEDLVENYTLGILSTIETVAENMKQKKYFYRDQDKILEILKNSIIVD